MYIVLKSNTVAAVVLVIVVIGVVAGTLALTDHSETDSSSSVVSSTGSVSSLSTSLCTLNGWGQIGLTVIDSSTQEPIPGLSVQVNETTGVCVLPEGNLGTSTDTNGTVMAMGVGSFLFSVKYNGSEFSAAGEVGPMGLTCVTLYVPSGQVTNRSTSLSDSAHYCSDKVLVSATTWHTNST